MSDTHEVLLKRHLQLPDRLEADIREILKRWQESHEW
jgi:hypothetical protein